MDNEHPEVVLIKHAIRDFKNKRYLHSLEEQEKREER